MAHRVHHFRAFGFFKRQKRRKLRNRTPEPGRLRQSSIAKPPILKRLFGLWFVLILLAVAVMPIDARWGLSLLWGFSVCLLPAVCFSWYAFRYQGARVVTATVKMFYRAETVKFLLTAILFAVVFHHADRISTAVFFLAFIAAQIASWLISAMSLKSRFRK